VLAGQADARRSGSAHRTSACSGLCRLIRRVGGARNGFFRVFSGAVFQGLSQPSASTGPPTGITEFFHPGPRAILCFIGLLTLL